MSKIEKISIIVPVFNEEESIKPFYEKILPVLKGCVFAFEIIFIDDGSMDESWEALKKITSTDNAVKLVRFKKNFGQTAAISAGIENSTGDIIIPIDSDLENDPEDIPKLLEKIEDGYDVVSGWRKNRWQEKIITRKLPSVIANWVISKTTGIKLHDYGCTLKAYKKEVIKSVRLYGEMHRFIPVYAALHGAKVAEIVVNYKPRKYGKSNYGLSRTFKVILDLFTVVFLSKYFSKPMHFFGHFGLILLFMSFLSGTFALFLKLFKGVSFISTPLPLLTVFLIIIGFLFILMGLLAEILIRIYYESNNKAPSYSVKEKVNF